MTYATVDHFDTKPVPWFRETVLYQVPRSGIGLLAGDIADGIVTVEGVPVAAEVRVYLRRPTGAAGDAALVAITKSAPDGTWSVTGLPMGYTYDVVARKDGQNDAIMSNVTPHA